jgi:hypothetical protein
VTHLTNAAVQRNHPDYKSKKEETIMSMESLCDYLIEKGQCESKEQFDTKVTKGIREIMRLIF